jgi:hypothetical protein
VDIGINDVVDEIWLEEDDEYDSEETDSFLGDEVLPGEADDWSDASSDWSDVTVLPP